MPLTPGYFFALDAAGLKALRAKKGDPARRQHLTEIRDGRIPGRFIDLGEAWSWVRWLVGRSVFAGKSLHRGSLGRIEVLPIEALNAAMLKLPSTRAELEAAFLAIDLAAFSYSMVPFWVKEEWARDGVTELLTAERATRVAEAIERLRVFVDETSSEGRSLVMFADYRL